MIEEANLLEVLPFIKKHFPNFSLKKDPYEKVYVYKEKDILGFISYSIIYERGEINYIAVSEKVRLKGIGTKLLNFALEDAIKCKVEKMSLEVSVNNVKAINFYLKNGFEIKATRKNYYEDGDAYLMVLEMM